MAGIEAPQLPIPGQAGVDTNTSSQEPVWSGAGGAEGAEMVGKIANASNEKGGMDQASLKATVPLVLEAN